MSVVTEREVQHAARRRDPCDSCGQPVPRGQAHVRRGDSERPTLTFHPECCHASVGCNRPDDHRPVLL